MKKKALTKNLCYSIDEMIKVEKKAEMLEFALVKVYKAQEEFKKGNSFLMVAFGSFVSSIIMSLYGLPYWWIVFIVSLIPAGFALNHFIKYGKIATERKYNVRMSVKEDKIVIEPVEK